MIQYKEKKRKLCAGEGKMTKNESIVVQGAAKRDGLGKSLWDKPKGFLPPGGDSSRTGPRTLPSRDIAKVRKDLLIFPCGRLSRRNFLASWKMARHGKWEKKSEAKTLYAGSRLFCLSEIFPLYPSFDGGKQAKKKKNQY